MNDLIDVISQEQQPDGSFLTYTSSSPSFEESNKTHTTFIPSLILSALNTVHDKNLVNVKKKLATYLLSQKSIHWTWNYWARDSDEYTSLPYPDDVDDTFCALGALSSYDSSCIPGNALAACVKGLTSLETQEGGPYYTWYTDDNNWKDIDVAVNSAVGWFLSLHDIELPHLTSFIDKHIDSEKLTSPYYPSSAFIIYSISRWHRKPELRALAQKYVHTETKLSVLDRILLSSALSRLGISTQPPLPKTIQPHPICIDPAVDGKTHYAGARALTAALALEAYTLRNDVSRKSHTSNHAKMRSTHYTSVVKSVKKRFKDQPPIIKKVFTRTLNAIVEGDHDQSIVLGPVLFAKCLKDPPGEKFIQSLCEANVYGWIAYTLYDDIIDEDVSPHLLPVANICLRRVSDVYLEVTEEDFHSEFRRVMDAIDQSNMWELTHARDKSNPPTYKDLRVIANKSLGHALGPLALVHHSGFPKESNEYQHVLSFFIHYIVARQLGDDAHDWENDLHASRITPVVARLLRDTQHENYAEVYWTKTIHKVLEDITHHIDRSHEHLEKCDILTHTQPLNILLTHLEDMVSVTYQKHMESERFLDSF